MPNTTQKVTQALDSVTYYDRVSQLMSHTIMSTVLNYMSRLEIKPGVGISDYKRRNAVMAYNPPRRTGTSADHHAYAAESPIGSRNRLFNLAQSFSKAVPTIVSEPKKEDRVQVKEDCRPPAKKVKPKTAPVRFTFSSREQRRSARVPQTLYSSAAYLRGAEASRRRNGNSEPPTMVLPTNFKAR